MKKIFILLLVLSASACHSNIPGLSSTDTRPTQIEQTGTLQGMTGSDYDSFTNVSFTSQTQFKITVNNVLLNQYEFTYSNNRLQFGHQVTVWPNGSISYKTPFIPVAPAGSMFKIEFDN